jgi:outer membrane usher protein
VPLSKWLPQSWASYSVNMQKNGPETHQVGLSGTALADNNLSYLVQQGYTSSGGESRSAVSGTYKGGYGTVSAGYNHSRQNSQLNSACRGIVGHEHGVTFSQPLGDTVVLLEAQGAPGVRVRNNPGVRTDWRGYAVVPHASAYQENRIAIDTGSLGPDVDVAESVVNVVPTRGAVVRATFNARTGYRALITLLYQTRRCPLAQW